MSEFLARLFDTSGFVPRRQCGHWSEELVRLHVGSDLAIWLAYMTIPAVLVFFVRLVIIIIKISHPLSNRV